MVRLREIIPFYGRQIQVSEIFWPLPGLMEKVTTCRLFHGFPIFPFTDPVQPRKLASLGQGPASSAAPFYPLLDFAAHPGLMGGEPHLLKEMPSYLMMSENHYRKVSWRT